MSSANPNYHSSEPDIEMERLEIVAPQKLEIATDRGKVRSPKYMVIAIPADPPRLPSI